MKIKSPKQMNEQNLSATERFAVWITGWVGTIEFFGIVFAWTVLWLGWNMFAPAAYRFDPQPAFVLWLFVSNVIQIFLMPLIMVGQNLQSRVSEMRAESDYEVNIKAEEEIKKIMSHLERQDDMIKKILEKVDSPSHKASA